MSRLTRILPLLAVAALAGCLPTAACAYIDITPANRTLNTNWSGGDVIGSVDYCVVSVDGTDQTGTSVLPYDVRVTSPSGALQLDGPGGSVPVAVEWTDLETGITQALQHGLVTPRDQTGVVDPCPAGDNARATVRVMATDLYTLAPGTYSATLRFRVRNLAAGVRRDVGVARLNITVPTVVHLGGLDSLALGTWSGSGALAGSDSLCVFINSGAPYSVTATGSGAGGAFALANGGASIAYIARWDDGGGAQPLSAATALPGRANANSTSIDCASGSNAVFSVEVPAENLQQAAGTGTYAGSVTITVQAQ
jgi:hypothetical protein